MTERHEPDLGHHPNLNKEPLRTGNPPDMHVDREDVAFRPPTWVVDRMSAGVIMLILAGVAVAAAIYVFGFLSSQSERAMPADDAPGGVRQQAPLTD